jgi:lysophospholipase L1-like esterase
VVFFGDSITDNWSKAGYGGFFPGKPYVNRGIGGQTTSQMLVRFRADVLALDPDVVVILAGTNDVAGNSGPSRPRPSRTTWPAWPSWPRSTASVSCWPRSFQWPTTRRMPPARR